MNLSPEDATSAAPVVSIIIPTYKVKDYIAACARSLFNQTFREGYEIIVVDDADPDASVQEVKAIEGKKPANATLRYLEHDRNRGLSAARNTGTAAAKGEYILYVDSDDELYPECLELLVNAARRNNADVVEGAVRMTNPLDGADTMPHSTCLLSGREAVEAFCRCELLCTAWNKLIRRDFLERTGVRFVEGLLHEDVVWSLEILLAGASVAGIQETTYLYRTDRTGAITSASYLARLPHLVRVYNYCAEALQGHGYADCRMAHQFLAYFIIHSTLKLFGADATGKKHPASFRLCWKAATQLQGISPTLRRFLLRSDSSRAKLVGWGLRLPFAKLRVFALASAFYLLAMRKS